MYLPSPPRLTYAAMVAVAMICSVVLRRPPRMSGIALGISTRSNTWVSVMPMARAASTTFASTFAMPEYVPANRG